MAIYSEMPEGNNNLRELLKHLFRGVYLDVSNVSSGYQLVRFSDLKIMYAEIKQGCMCHVLGDEFENDVLY